jgi:hypothetical protein
MKYVQWTNQEIARLRLMFPISSTAKLVREFYPHPLGSIQTRASILGLRRRRDWMAIAKAHSPIFIFPPTAREA